MKRNLLAIAIPALLVAGAANASIEVWNKDGNKVSFNGRVKAMNYITERLNEQDKEGDHSDVRLGFTGETQITDSLTGYGRAEWEVKTGNSENIKTRYAFAGLNFGNIGSIDYGKNDGILKAITAYTDVLPEFGGDAANNDYYLLSARSKAVATYRNANFFGLVDGLSMALQYADNSEDADGSNKSTSTAGRDEAYGVNFDYAILDTGLSVAAGYAQASGSEKPKSWAVGLKYDANDLYIAANYLESKNMGVTNAVGSSSDKVRGFEVVAQYGIDFEVGRLTPSVAYIQHKLRNATNGDLVKYVDVGATYDFNKNLSAIVDYKINLMKTSDYGKENSRDVVGLGLIYQF